MNKKYEQGIILKDLVFYILRKLNRILLCGFIIFALLGIYKFTTLFLSERNKQDVIVLQEKYNKDIEEYKVLKEGYEKAISKLVKSIEYEEKYEKESVLFNLDPYYKWTATADIFINMSQNSNNTPISVDPADGVIYAYSALVSKGSYQELLSKRMGIEITYVKELIKISTDTEGNMLSISISYSDQNNSQEMLKTVLSFLDSNYSEISQSLGEHSFVVINQNVSLVVDEELALSQKQKIDGLQVARNKLIEMQKLLDDLQEPQKKLNLSYMGMIKLAVIYGGVAAIIGVFAIIFLYIVIYVLNPNLYSVEEFRNRFNLKILGVFMQKRKESIFETFLDNLEGKEFKSESVVYQRIVANIANYNIDGKKILVTGTVNEEALLYVSNKLKQMLPDLKIYTGKDMNKDPNTLTLLLKVDSIVLVEKIGASKYNDIQEELETLYDLNQKVIGCIII